MRHYGIHFLVSLLACVVCVACADNSGPYQEEFVAYDIVRFDGQSKSKGADFTFYMPNSDTPVCYNDPRGEIIDTLRVAPGNRLLLGYIPEKEPYVDGTIHATGYSVIRNDTLCVNQANDLDAGKLEQGIYVYSMWRTGTYLNVHGKVTFSEDSTSISLAVNGSNLSAGSVPRLYLDYFMENPRPNFEREFYASFDVSLLNPDDYPGFCVEVNNTNLKQNSFTFMY